MNEVPRNGDEDKHLVNRNRGLNTFKSKRLEEKVHVSETPHIQVSSHALLKPELKV